MQLERDRETNAIRGSIQVSGSYPLAHAARIDGILDEGSVSGRILDAEGNPLGTFTGVATAGGMSGAYATWDGDQGTWVYRDRKPEPVPAHLREAEARLGAGN